ncbi:MAG TPA: hypothetical protein VKT49_03125 [Bryobacteraceae bacterium]|nr:hypothetical protein [Bryobacteraceae bacterium]
MKGTFLLAVLVFPLAAQPPKPPDSQTPAPAPASRPAAQRVFILKYADPLAMADVLRVFGASVAANQEIHAVAVASAFPDVLASVDDAINRLDIPSSAPQNIELTAFYVIGGNTNIPLGTPLPKDLDSLAAELTATAALRNYRLLDALTIRMRAGQGADTSGSAGPVAANSPVIVTDLRVRTATVSTDGATVRLDRLNAGVKLPVAAGGGQYTTSDLNFNADLDLKAGQRIVAGRVGMNKDQALFVVLAARIAR